MPLIDLVEQTGPLIILAGIMGILTLTVVVLYAMTASKERAKDEDGANRLSNGLGITGIVLCLFGGLWAAGVIIYVRDSRNIWADASSIYSSRQNIVANWYNPITSKVTIPISSTPPQDGNVCFMDTQLPTTPASFDNYKKLITAANSTELGGGIPQTYAVGPKDPVTDIVPTKTFNMTIEHQQQLTLAYYRYVYCIKTSMANALNDQWTEFASFLPATTYDNLKNHIGCQSATPPFIPPLATPISVPDTRACLDPDWLKDGKVTCGAPNPCFTALVESVSAQCLLYDDGVRTKQTLGITTTGALDSFSFPKEGQFLVV